MKDITATKTENIVLSILAYSGGSLPADDVIKLADYINEGNKEEVNTRVTNLVGLKSTKVDKDE